MKIESPIYPNVIVDKLCIEFRFLLEGHRSPGDGEQIRQNIQSRGGGDVRYTVIFQEGLDDAVVVKEVLRVILNKTIQKALVPEETRSSHAGEGGEFRLLLCGDGRAKRVIALGNEDTLYVNLGQFRYLGTVGASNLVSCQDPSQAS